MQTILSHGLRQIRRGTYTLLLVLLLPLDVVAESSGKLEITARLSEQRRNTNSIEAAESLTDGFYSLEVSIKNVGTKIIAFREMTCSDWDHWTIEPSNLFEVTAEFSRNGSLDCRSNYAVFTEVDPGKVVERTIYLKEKRDASRSAKTVDDTVEARAGLITKLRSYPGERAQMDLLDAVTLWSNPFLVKVETRGGKN